MHGLGGGGRGREGSTNHSMPPPLFFLKLGDQLAYTNSTLSTRVSLQAQRDETTVDEYSLMSCVRACLRSHTTPSDIVSPLLLHWAKGVCSLCVTSHGELQDLTNGLAHSNGVWNGSQYRKQQDHDQQRDQHQCMNGQRLEEVTSFKYPGATPCSA